MVQTRSKSGKKRSRVKKERGCKCCEEKTKYSDLKLNQNGKSEIHNFINNKDSNTKVSKKPSGKRGGSPITTSGILQRRNSGNLEDSERSNEQCVKMVDDWLKNFQIEKSPMEEQSMEEPSTSVSPPLQHAEYEEQSQGALSPMDSAGPPSVGSSASAPSPASSGGVSSSASQDEQPDSTDLPRRTPERREKQRQASAKSRKKKKAEEDILQVREQALVSDNARLEGVIQGLVAQRTRYLSGEYEVDDEDVFDPEEPPKDQSDKGAGPNASS